MAETESAPAAPASPAPPAPPAAPAAPAAPPAPAPAPAPPAVPPAPAPVPVSPIAPPARMPLKSYLAAKSRTDRRIELLSGFYADMRLQGVTRATEAEFDARFAAWARSEPTTAATTV